MSNLDNSGMFPIVIKQPQNLYTLITMKCINCGAENSFKTRSVECEYCRTVLYRELPDVPVPRGGIDYDLKPPECINIIE